MIRILIAASLFASALHGQAPLSLQGLVDDSPFLPPGFNQQEAAAEEDARVVEQPVETNLVFRGFTRVDGEWRLSIFDKNSQRGAWLLLNEAKQGFPVQVTSFDPEQKIVMVQGGSGPERLTLSPIKASGAVAPPRPRPAVSGAANDGERSERPVRRRVIVPRRR